MKEVTETHDLMIITQVGNVVRIPVSGLRVMGRATQGVRLINLKENDSIASVAYVELNEDDSIIDPLIAEENDKIIEENGKEFDV